MGKEQAKGMTRPYIAHVKPAMVLEKSITALLPQRLYNGSVEEVIEYVLNKPEMKVDERRVAGRVRDEMVDPNYQVIVNGQQLPRTESVEQFYVADSFYDEEDRQMYEYNKLEIIVSRPVQEGGLSQDRDNKQ